MNKEARLRAAIDGRQVDRIPVSVWYHLSAIDQDSLKLAQATADITKKFDFDFVKMMPFGLYSAADLGAEITYFSLRGKPPVVKAPGIRTEADYLRLPHVDVKDGAHGRQLVFAEELAKQLPKDVPFIQTIFSPLTTLHKLAGDRLLKDLVTVPDPVHHALEAITEITVMFAQENIRRGVSGFFFATQEARRDLLSLNAFRTFAEPYDLAVQQSYAGRTWFNVTHLHGLDVYFEEVATKYPGNVINWHDQHTFPSISEAKKLTNKALLAGLAAADTVVGGKKVRDDIVLNGTPAAIAAAVKRAIAASGGRSFILGPGCVVDQFVSEENLLAVRKAAEL